MKTLAATIAAALVDGTVSRITGMKVVKTISAGPGPVVVLPAAGHVWIPHTTGTSIWRL